MKKRVFFAVLALALLLTMTACKPDEKPQTTDETDTTTVAPATTTAEATTTAPVTTTTTAKSDDEPYEFTCDELHFSLTMPASWEGAFTHRHDGNVVSFYELSNHLYDSNGHLFTIRFMSPEIDVEFPSYRTLGTYGGWNVIALFPTDVQFNFDDDDMTKKYLTMSEEVDAVLATFVYNGEA